jgi:two-component system OmpR family response regulator
MMARENNREIPLLPKILLVEDDHNLGLLLQEALGPRGFDVTLCRDGEEALRVFFNNIFDLCLIDVMLPRTDGFALGRDIRRVHPDVPMVFLTAKSLQEDRIEGFRIGADDYITKPFSLEELVLRIRAVLRRSKVGGKNSREHRRFSLGLYSFDYEEQTLSIKSRTRKLTTKEAELLRLLCLHANSVLERSLALQLIWGSDSVFNARSMDVFISKLRKYLSEDAAIEILNVHGRGYKLMLREYMGTDHAK